MAYDVVIKNGRIYDGSGLPSFTGDVAINGAQIVEVGRINSSARRVIQADGLAVALGSSCHFLLLPWSHYSDTGKLWSVACALPPARP